MKKIFTTLTGLLAFVWHLNAQSVILNNYINEGLNNNLALKQQHFALDKSYYALKEARGLFLPSLYVQADYNYADGGRKINLPVGDLLNPVYSTLNQLTGSSAFPQIRNVNEQFLPNDFHDTRLRATLPLINAEIWYNQKIRKEAISQQQAAVNVYKRELVMEIKTAYYNYMRALKAVKIYTQADVLLNENLKLTESLVKNNLTLKSNLLKVTADLNKNRALKTEAENNVKSAGAYLNFLLNKPLDTPVLADTTVYAETVLAGKMAQSGVREELVQLKSGISQTRQYINLKKSYLLPTVGTFLDAGYQGFYYKFNNDQRYYLGGVQLKWNLFNGFQNRHKIHQADIDLKQLEARYTEAEKQIELQSTTSNLALNSAVIKAESTKTNMAFSEEFYRVTRSRYAAGEALVIELSDAFFQLVNNQLQYELAQTEVLIKQAEAERANATFKF